MRQIRRALRSAAAFVLYRSGLLGLLLRRRLRGRAVVLMYHRVLGDAERRVTVSHPAIVVSRATFAMQMAELKRHVRVLTFAEFVSHVASGQPFPDASCLITFDDGWADNVTNAWPVLYEHRLPATVFLPVNFIGTDRMFWRETLTGLLATALGRIRRDASMRSAIHAVLEPRGLAHLLDTTAADPRPAISEALGSLKGTDPSALDALVEGLAAALSVAERAVPASDAFMAWDDVTALHRSGVTFGGHGAEHLLLDRVAPDEAARDVDASWSVLRRHLPDAVLGFAYPNGNWSPAVAKQVAARGFRVAFTTEPGSVSAGDEPFSLRRINIHEDVTNSPSLFIARLAGLL